MSPTQIPVPAVGVVCLRGGDVLLIRRATPPLQGHWSLPGGRLRWGERLKDAALRELKEETGIEAEIVGLIDVVDGVFDQPEARHYVLIDYLTAWKSGEPKAGDGAAEARFFSAKELEALELWGETRRIIAHGRALISDASAAR